MEGGDIDIDADIPPLEDMSELIQRAQQLQQTRERKETKRSSGSDKPSSNLVQPEIKAKEALSTKDTKMQGDEQNTSSASKPGTKPASKKADSFGGMKKGFLFGSTTKSSKPSSQARQKQGSKEGASSQGSTASPSPGNATDDIPLIKPQGDGAQNGAQRIPEVQEALKASAPFLENKDWINDNLLEKVEKHPRLAHQMMDPRFSQAMAMFQNNPQAAMQYFQNNPDIQAFFQDFCGILGDHFSSLGVSSDKSPTNSTSPSVQEVKVHEGSGADMTVASSTNANQATAADEAKMREIMSDPEVVKAFADPRTPQLFDALRTNSAQAQRMMQTADAAFRQHIQTLVKKGLLGFAR